MSELYESRGFTYCGEPYGPPTVYESGEARLTFSSTCGYAIVNEKCNSKWEHPHPGVGDTNALR